MKKKITILLSLIVIGILAILYFKPFSNPQIIILDHLTEIHDGTVDQICLVKNLPSSSKELQELIEEFNHTNMTTNGNFKRLFIKEHDYIFLPALTLSKNLDYSSETITRNDLDNIDFLANSSSFLSKYEERINILNVNAGELWYYKK